MRDYYLQLCEYGSRFRILKGGKISLVVSAFLAGTTLMHAAPTGGVVTSGNANIAQSGLVTTINQSSQKASINWQGFSIGSNETVNFNQPSISAITLNRVIGNEKSIIDGALNANGQVWILNSNGVLFNANAKVNTSGLLATTKSLSDADFQAGNYSFKGDSTASVINLGTININNGGYASLLANSVTNEGTIKAIKGTVTLTGANEATINLNGNSLVSLKVDKGVLDALVENKGAIIADGGKVYLTTNAANELLKGVVNNTGVIEANSMDDITGEIVVYAHGGTANIGGTINAQGGFVETSGKEFAIQPNATVKAAEWLIDPVNITIDNTLATAIETGLASGNVKITTDTTDGSRLDTTGGESGTEGDINVNSAITWNTDNTLTLSAYNNINVNEDITHTGTSAGGIIFLYGQGTADGGTSTYNVASGKTVTSPSLQWRKGSDLDSTRYAIVDGSVFLGGKYIEIGINDDAGGKFGTTNKPSLFFGRQGGNSGIGMVGDADGFASGSDLRIDYFMPGSPWEAFAVAFNGLTQGGSDLGVTSTNIALLPLSEAGIMSAKVTSMIGDLKVEQVITLGRMDKYFGNEVTLTNIGSSTLTDTTFARYFDPDNTVDKGGDYTTINTIESRTLDGGSANVVSAVSLAGDAYATASGGSQAKILYYTTDTRAIPGIDDTYNSNSLWPFWANNIANMLTTARSEHTGTTTTEDSALGILFNVGSLSASQSTTFKYLTSLDNRDMSTILSELNTASGGSTPAPTPRVQTSDDLVTKTQALITQIVNDTAIQTPVIPSFTPPVLTLPTPPQSFSIGGQPVQLMSTPLGDTPTQIISLSDVRQMQQESAGGSSGAATTVGSTNVRIPLGSNSLIQLVNGGVNLPAGVDQEFFMAQR